MTARPPDPAAARTEPRFALGWAALVYALALLTLAWPALGGGFLVSETSDQYIAGYAFREFAASALRAGQAIPEWNPYLFGGMPFIAAMHGDIFYPTFLLRLVMPTDAAMTWSFILHYLLAALFTYAFLRAWGLGFLPSLLGGLAYMLTGPIASYVSPGHDGKLYVSTLLPLALLLVVRGIRDGRAWSWGLLALTIGLAVLSPHPQLLQYLLLTTGAFALFVAFSDHSTGRLPRAVAARRLLLALGCVALGFLMGAVQYWPVMEYVDWSPRAGGKGWEHAISYSMPIEEMVNLYLPQFTGMLDAYWGRNGIHFHSEYLGASVLVLLGAAFGAGSRRGFKWFWLGALVVSTLWALGGNTPFYHLVYALVPGSKFFRAPSTMLMVVAFSVCVLASLGVERALAGRVSARYLAGWAIGAGVVALLATVGGLTTVATSIADPARWDLVQANNAAVVAGAWRSLLVVLLVAGTMLLGERRRLSALAVGAALTVLVTGDLWSILRDYWRFSPGAARIFASDATIEYVKAQSEPGRVLAQEIPRYSAGRDPFIRGDALMVHDIRTVLGYHGNELGRYQQLVYPSSPGGNPNLFALTNARFLLTNAELQDLPRLVGPVKNAYGTEVSLYRLPGENPAAWVTPLVVKASDDQVLPTLLDARFDVRRAALFDTNATVRAATDVRALPEPLAGTRAVVTTYEPGRIDLRLEGPVPDGAGLVVSENYYPGWRATVDGRETTVSRVDFTLIGLQLPGDARSVSLRFENARDEQGKTVTLLAVALSVLAAAAGLLVSRRRRG
jgi:hypothetical protein